MNEFVYEIIGKPVPLARPRFTKGRVWDSQKDQKLYDWFQLKRIHHSRHLPYDRFVGPLNIDMTFIFVLPRSLKKLNPYWHTTKGDCDNYIKYVCDIGQMESLLYDDDACISEINARKIYGPVAKTVIIIRNL